MTQLGSSTLVLTAGQIAADAAGTPLAPGDVGAQTRSCSTASLTDVVKAGASLTDVVKVQVFLTDMLQFAAASAIRNEYLAGINPASTVVEIGQL